MKLNGKPNSAITCLIILHHMAYFMTHNHKPKVMSQAFVRESDEQWLHDVTPTMQALIVYLTRENNGIRVYEQKTYIDQKSGKEVHLMSNGLSYSKDEAGKWTIIW
jgi:hypothetical protein